MFTADPNKGAVKESGHELAFVDSGLHSKGYIELPSEFRLNALQMDFGWLCKSALKL